MSSELDGRMMAWQVKELSDRAKKSRHAIVKYVDAIDEELVNRARGGHTSANFHIALPNDYPTKCQWEAIREHYSSRGFDVSRTGLSWDPPGWPDCREKDSE